MTRCRPGAGRCPRRSNMRTTFLTDEDREEINAEFPDDPCCVALWATPRMHALIATEIERLRALQAALKPTTLELDRAEVAHSRPVQRLARGALWPGATRPTRPEPCCAPSATWRRWTRKVSALMIREWRRPSHPPRRPPRPSSRRRTPPRSATRRTTPTRANPSVIRTSGCRWLRLGSRRWRRRARSATPTPRWGGPPTTAPRPTN